MNNTCSICLNPLEKDHVKKKLTCGHEFHFRCFLSIVYREKNVFIQCPLCRQFNEDTSKPFNDPEKNLRILCSRKVGKVRCICRTKQGTVCKRKAKLLNYGMCYQHNSIFLKNELYPLMEKYIYFILCQRYTFISRLYAIDIGKQLIIKHSKEATNIEDILTLWLKYISIKGTKGIQDYEDIYEYYELIKPPKEWIEYCEKKCLII